MVQASAKCIPFEQASTKIGEIACISGKVLAVQASQSGNHYLEFCEDYRTCPFFVVIFPDNLRDVGDVRELQGKVIAIHGKVKLYNGRAEIILRDARQLRGAAAKLPPVPKTYDVQRRGRYSAGKFGSPNSSQGRSTRRQRSSTEDSIVDER